MSRTHIDTYTPELLPSSSQFFPAGAELPFSSPPFNEERQAGAGFTYDNHHSHDSTVQQSNPAELWQQPAQAVRRQHDGELPQQLYAHHMHLQSRDVPELITAGSSDGLASSINSRSGRLLSLPSDSQQISVGGSSIGRYSISRPGELSPVPERSGTSPLPASELTTAEFGQLKAVQQLSVLQLPGVTCQAAGDARLKSQSVPSSPIHGNKTFITRSLSLQKSLETDNLQQQMHRRSQEYQKVSYTRDAPVPGVAAATAEFRHTITTGDSATSSVGSQQQEVLADRVGGSNSRRSSRDIARQLTGHADSVQGSVGNEAELLLQAEVARLRDESRSNQERVLLVQQQLTQNQELLTEKQEQLLATQAEVAAASKHRSALEEQIQHLEAKVHATESQLEFAHKQLDIRQQELRSQADAATAAKRSGEQLVTELETLKDELLASRREVEAVNKRLMLEAAEARRAADESSCLRRDLTALQAEFSKSKQETADARERMRQAAVEADRRTAQLEEQIAELSQQNMMLKERMLAMQTANEGLHSQLASAENDNSVLRSDMANLLSERQELMDGIEKLRQLQLENSRRMGQLESDLTDASQQLMFMKSQNERLGSQLSTATAENAVLRADLENSRAALNSANRAVQEAHMQQDDLMQQARQKVRQQQLQIQQLQQQLDQAAAVSAASLAVQPAVSGFGIGSSYPGLSGGSYRGGRLSFGDDDVASSRTMGWASPTSRTNAYDFMSVEAGRTAQQQPGYSYSSLSHPAATGTVSSTVSPDRYAPAVGSAGNLGREASAYYAAPAATQYSPESRQLPKGGATPSRGLNQGWLEQGAGAEARKGPGYAAATESGAVETRPGSQPQQQQAKPASSSKADDVPWFAGGSRTSPGRSGRTAAAQQFVQQQQPTANTTASAGYLTAERFQHWQPLPQANRQVQQQQQAVAAGPGSVSSSSPMRTASKTLTEQQQYLQAAAGAAVPTPFGTEMTVAEIMARTKELEDHLLAYCQEKDDLNKEFSRMPVGAGRTLKERQRKQFVEQRLEELDSAISKTRMQLKRFAGR